MESSNMPTMDQTLDGRKTRLEDKDPVLTLLLEISASLKDLNLTFKGHAERLIKLEEQKPGYESRPRDRGISEQSEGDNGPIQAQSAHENPEKAGTLKIMRPELITQNPQIPQEPLDHSIEVKHGTFPPVEAYSGHCTFRDSRKAPQLWGNQDYLSWLKEKRLAFPDDGRCKFSFDIATLADFPDLNVAHQKIDEIDEFSRDLKKRGGFFFLRDNDMQGGNKIWNGTDIYTLPDKFPLPFPSTEAAEGSMWELLADINEYHDPSPERLLFEPSTFYKPTEAYWKMKAPFRRLCVFAGLSKKPHSSTYNSLSSNPSELVPLLTEDDTNLKRHLALEQFWHNDGLKKDHRSSWCSVKFQFVWYEIVNHSGHEVGRPSGGLYRDDTGQKLQLQSFLVNAIWSPMSDSSSDSEYWTIILMIPASFYNVSKPYMDFVYNRGSAFLMKPLESSFPMLVSITSEVIPRLMREWTTISDYIEKFVVSKFTFLKEEKHDLLLFDDDTFSRSRQYFWVITTISEFILIIDRTLHTWGEMTKWRKDLNLVQEKDISQLMAIKERFENQKKRAEALRDGLFSASAVVESRLSTRLAQNVKLLTYVSIFYLPLAFCAALWAIPNITDSSTRTPFIIAAALVGFVTYMIVFNLNALASFGWATYSGLRDHSIQQMKQNYSAEQKWGKLGRDFKRFEPKHGSTKPSDWYILLYCILHPQALFKKSPTPEIASEETSEKDAGLQRPSSWTRWLHLSNSKSKPGDRKGKGPGGV